MIRDLHLITADIGSYETADDLRGRGEFVDRSPLFEVLHDVTDDAPASGGERTLSEPARR